MSEWQYVEKGACNHLAFASLLALALRRFSQLHPHVFVTALEPLEHVPCVHFKPAIIRRCNDTSRAPFLLPQTCPDSIARKWSSTDFNGSFLGTIPVLQWAKDVTLQQHQRLKQFGGPYGWNSLDYDSKNCIFLQFRLRNRLKIWRTGNVAFVRFTFASINSHKDACFSRIWDEMGNKALTPPLCSFCVLHMLCAVSVQRFCYHVGLPDP